ncbi:SagB family peptide dehydrogenase [Bradyrhizobium sp. NP1]|uniref:SagB/ThcOx family dehydrogenase n=1 Tax=Bradyrhizobium sp. NP1 TaxID=3049772 RepID=UPI0025A6042A|nr:SagB family peptide dehydrogenase [Bradyrhizobium sp. NP1]WJR75040.1 SagB family peptide dehydrogenase [Bradyrhizobium sp. NP1]
MGSERQIRSTRKRATARPTLSVRLNDRVTLEGDVDGNIAVSVEGFREELGRFSTAAAKRAAALRSGIPLSELSKSRSAAGKEIGVLAQRLARRGLVEYGLRRARGGDLVAIEPQGPDYWPKLPKLGLSDTVALSRFAYLRRRGHDMVLESPRAGALFRIGDPAIAGFLAALAVPQKVREVRRRKDFPGDALLALLLDAGMLLKLDAGGDDGRRTSEGDPHLVLWDFHDLLFHTHSTEGRQANPLGGVYSFADLIRPPPAVRPSWPGKKIALGGIPDAEAEPSSAYARLVHARESIRDFDDARPITLAELGELLARTARVQSKWTAALDFEGGGPEVDFTTRPYPSAGSAYELELYLTVVQCEGLARGFYHYDADQHALVAIEARPDVLEAMLQSAQFAMDAAAPPQILVTIAARFERISWKYRAIAYSLILKDVGVLTHALYMAAADMGLGGCAIGASNIELFVKATGIPFHVEGPVGQFALGRGAPPT